MSPWSLMAPERYTSSITKGPCHFVVGASTDTGGVSLGCVASGVDETPSSPRNDHTRHTTILPWFRPREGISRKTLRSACLIPYRWKSTMGGILIIDGLEATSLRQKSHCPRCYVGEEPKLVFLHFSTNPESVSHPGQVLLLYFKGIPQWPRCMRDKCQASLSGGMAGWHYETRCPTCRLAHCTDGMRPAGLISLYLAWCK
jgi:hypothetical protein